MSLTDLGESCKLSEDSEPEESRQQDRANRNNDRNEDDVLAAYRKSVRCYVLSGSRLTSCRLYAILTIMTLVMFGINILQVYLLTTTTNQLWLILCPVVVFALFMIWAFAYVLANRNVFHPSHLNFSRGLNHALQHLRALFMLRGRSKRSSSKTVRRCRCIKRSVKVY